MTEKYVKIERWKLEKIEDAMRININSHSMRKKECCAHRQMMKAYAWVVQALEVVSSVPQANELSPHVSKCTACGVDTDNSDGLCCVCKCRGLDAYE
jgi:hypothetical protein